MFSIILALHIISVVCWFAAIFYLPRLFVYHADAKDLISIERFKTMERRLYYGIGWPAGVATTVLGLALILQNKSYYLHAYWLHLKLFFVILLWVYFLSAGYFLKNFKKDKNKKTALFFRIYNELPTVLLIIIVFLVVIKPS